MSKLPSFEYKKMIFHNVRDNLFQSSIKDIELSLSYKFMKIESKYRFKYGGKSKDLHIEIFRDEKFEDTIRFYPKCKTLIKGRKEFNKLKDKLKQINN
jgi:hypothetical protein